MLLTKYRFNFFLGFAIFLISTVTTPGRAEVEKLRVQIFGTVSNYDAQQIRRLLSPWVDAQNVNFVKAVDEHGRESQFTTVVEITPRREEVDIDDIVRQLKDQRFRGRPSVSRPWVVKVDVTVTGALFTHAGWSRSSVRNVPSWRRWRPETSELKHALNLGGMRQKMVFSESEGFDQLRQKAGKGDRIVEIQGQIVGFDGPYPILSVKTSRVQYMVQPPTQQETQQEEGPDIESLEDK